MRKFFRMIMIILNIVVAVSLLLACLCSFVSPKAVWWIGFFGLAYMYLLTANLCFLAYWLLSTKKKLILISLVSFLIGWPFIGRNIQFFSKDIAKEEINESVKVLSYNVQGFVQMYPKSSDGKELNRFDFFHHNNDADIICMQEFVINRWGKDLNEKNIRKQLGKTPYCQIELTAGNSGLATFSKYPIIRKELIFSDNTTNACMCCDLLIESDTVRVYNVHLKSVGFGEEERQLLNNAVKKDYSGSDIRAMKAIIRQMKNSSYGRAKQVEILISHVAQSPYPVIICGDFNDPPMSHSYQKVRGNLKDAFIEAGSGRSTTYDIGRISSQRIDYILYSDIFKAYDYESPRVKLSDHFPIMCRMVRQ